MTAEYEFPIGTRKLPSHGAGEEVGTGPSVTYTCEGKGSTTALRGPGPVGGGAVGPRPRKHAISR